jgi:hypothetical protein
VSSRTRSPSPVRRPYYYPAQAHIGHIAAVVGAERSSASRPEPPSRASTSLSSCVSDIASELSHSSPSVGTFTPSPASSHIFQSQHSNHLPELPPQQGPPPPQLPNATFPTYVSVAAGPPPVAGYASSAVQTPPTIPLSPVSLSPPPPVPPRPVGPVTPAHRGVHAKTHSQSQFQSQSHQVGGPQVPPSSARSKGSVAETPSGDLANFHLLKGSPLQSVVDFDTPTPSPRTPSMPSVSPADAQAFALAIHGGHAADRRFLPGSSVSPSVSRAQRAVARSSFYCRICRADPCYEITATACGHMFCNACIVEEVRETARCPVCNAAVLLFAMLRLDIS